MKIGGRLQRFPFLWGAAALGLRGVSQPRRAKQIEQYLESNEVRKLRFGAGRHSDQGWLSTDLVPLSKKIVFMDGRKPLPLPSDSFDFVVCEHMIEHVDVLTGRQLIGEFRRILRVGGVLRIATPDFGRLVGFVSSSEPLSDDASYYVSTMNEAFSNVPDNDRGNPIYMINRMVRDWGHQFLYDEATLTRFLVDAGFGSVVRETPGKSEHPELVSVDRHQEETGERMNMIETLTLEAVATG
jgi:predicted SAM-dependent methyltransferase